MKFGLGTSYVCFFLCVRVGFNLNKKIYILQTNLNMTPLKKNKTKSSNEFCSGSSLMKHFFCFLSLELRRLKVILTPLNGWFLFSFIRTCVICSFITLQTICCQCLNACVKVNGCKKTREEVVPTHSKRHHVVWWPGRPPSSRPPLEKSLFFCLPSTSVRRGQSPYFTFLPSCMHTNASRVAAIMGMNLLTRPLLGPLRRAMLSTCEHSGLRRSAILFSGASGKLKELGQHKGPLGCETAHLLTQKPSDGGFNHTTVLSASSRLPSNSHF